MGVDMVTDRRDVEAAGLNAVPAERLVSFLQLAHELRSPLAVIMNSLDVVLQGYTADDPALTDKLLSRARDRADSMLAQVNDFLRLGAVRHEEYVRTIRPVQLLDVLETLTYEMRIRARWRSVQLSIQAPDQLPCIHGTYEDMEHLLSNLINNAIKYTKPGGHVNVALSEQADRVVGCVEDTGIGIPEEDLPRVFEEFFRSDNAKETAVHGTGLGLSIVKRIVDLYSGDITIVSVLGEGSAFTFSFPSL